MRRRAIQAVEPSAGRACHSLLAPEDWSAPPPIITESLFDGNQPQSKLFKDSACAFNNADAVAYQRAAKLLRDLQNELKSVNPNACCSAESRLNGRARALAELQPPSASPGARCMHDAHLGTLISAHTGSSA
ncbi:hypothetical protein T492DRAFT_891472 [Pavlovales sp. CCMP2436]|nr:hypothetical protein T492DRAFT_891472 [Pavlovales sp. CCMP2436]